MAAESSKLRLVRCPKCQNLLPELPNYSVYQCGGCGAVLRANKSSVEGSNVSDKERVAVVVSKVVNFTEKEGKEEIVGVGEVSGINGDSGVVSREVKVKVRVSDDSEGTSDERGKSDSKTGDRERVLEEGNFRKIDLGNGNLDSKVEVLDTNNVENAGGLRRSDRVLERKPSDRGMDDRVGRSRGGNFEGVRFSKSNQVGEGTSNRNGESDYQSQAGRSTRAEYVDADKEELLRKLDELKEQLSRVQNANGKSLDKTPVEQRMPRIEPYYEQGDYFNNNNNPSGYRRVSRQFSAPNKHVARPPYFEDYHEPLPVINGSDAAVHKYPNAMRSLNHVPAYENPFESRMFTRSLPPRIPTYHHHYMSTEPDPFEGHPYNMSVNHHYTCSCYHCYEQQEHIPMQVPQSTYGNRRFAHAANKGMPYQHELPGPRGSHKYGSRVVSNPQLGSCDPLLHNRGPGDLNLEAGGVPRTRPQRVVLANGRRCRPVAGGAPFVTCHNCFELLKLPGKVLANKGECKLSCGACSSEISFAIVDERLVSVDPTTTHTAPEAVNSSNGLSNGHVKPGHGSFCSEDYANSIYDFQAMDREPVSSSSCQGVSSSKSEEMHNPHSVSATTSEDEHFSDEMVARRGDNSTAEPPEKASSCPSPPGSPPQDPFDYTSKYRAVSRCGKGSLSSRSDQERVMTNKSTLRQNSLKESMATEMELAYKDYTNNGLSQDSADKSREDDQPKGKKDSFLAGIIKKSFRDLSKSNQGTESGKRNVTVNGHLIPDKLVKKAEKMAGPVFPGKYWYDYRAGFWGVVGGPCLGIIPPFIEEFNYPMPEKCAGGNTGVFVNGRELNHKDLDLLATRGLPSIKDRSYIVEISGRVVDEDSGEELNSLGKLAPTIEKVKHGFGMRVPEAA